MPMRRRMRIAGGKCVDSVNCFLHGRNSSIDVTFFFVLQCSHDLVVKWFGTEFKLGSSFPIWFCFV